MYGIVHTYVVHPVLRTAFMVNMINPAHDFSVIHEKEVNPSNHKTP